ncbi:MAG TPA: hypothetical protein VH740_20080 [Vicinamibacterales bacterium]|jgi:hypothetical protein
MRPLLAVFLLLSLPRMTMANGHGPVFGAATPTLGKGGWQVDQAWFGRLGEGRDTEEQTLRTMIGFGITEDLQISASVPISLVSSSFMPRGRMVASMSAEKDIEAIASWRFHRRATGAGSRFESTVSAGASLPLTQYRPDGMQAASSFHLSAASGYVSRTHYVWVGGGYHHHDQRGLDRMGDVAFVTGVYGYRPPALRLDYPKPDLRFFVEAVGERTARGRHHGFVFETSGGSALLVGPTALLLYKAYALEGGVLFPLYQDTNLGPAERLRFAVNFSYFFWRK